MTEPETPATALSSLRAALLRTRATPTAASSHPLGASSLGAARLALASSLTTLRLAADAPPVQKVATIQSDAARRAAHTKSVCEALASCRGAARRGDAFAPAWFGRMYGVKGAAERAGAQAFEGSPGDACATAYGRAVPEGGLGMLTICSVRFLADFLFLEDGVFAHFRHLVGEACEDEVGDAEVDFDFGRMVEEGRFGDVEEAFRILMRQEVLDREVVEGGAEVQVKVALRAFEDDLLAMQSAEKKVGACSMGKVRRSAKGLVIEFADGCSAILGAEAAFPEKLIAAGSCAPVMNQFRPGEGRYPEFQFSETAPIASVNAHYTLTLSEPVIASTVCAARLASAGGLAGDASAKKVSAALSAASSGRKKSLVAATAFPAAKAELILEATGPAKTGPVVTETGPSTSALLATAASNWTNHPKLEGLLAPDVLGDYALDAAAFASGVDVDSLSGGNEVTATAALPNGKSMKFSYTRSDCVPGVRIHHVPLTHPRDVRPIVRVLRQLLVFNALFSSCFATAKYAAADAVSVIEQAVEVIVCEAPGFLHFGMYDGATDSVVGVAVVVGFDGAVDVKIRGPKGRRHACSDRKASALFSAAHNVPLALDAIRSIGEKAAPHANSAAGKSGGLPALLNLGAGLGLGGDKGQGLGGNPGDSLIGDVEMSGIGI